jgi:erythromycin esterase-like protein
MHRSLAALVLAVCLGVTQAWAQASADDEAIDNAVGLIRAEAGGHRLLLLGEMHGTREIPELIGRLLAGYANQGPVLLGLEVHHSNQPALDDYVASNGDPAAQAALRATPFWNVAGMQHDGRRNLDLLALIEKVRRLRTQGRAVAILAYDNPPGANVDSQARDKAMAGRLRAAFAALPRGRLLVLSGNVHAMLERPEYAPVQMQAPMGSYMRDLDPFSVNIAASSGTFWACMAKCGPAAAQPSARTSGPDKGAYNLQIVLPRFSLARLIGADAAP